MTLELRLFRIKRSIVCWHGSCAKFFFVVLNHLWLLLIAILEALQQEEYQEERAHVQQLDDVEEDFIVYPADDSGVWNEIM